MNNPIAIWVGTVAIGVLLALGLSACFLPVQRQSEPDCWARHMPDGTVVWRDNRMCYFRILAPVVIRCTDTCKVETP